jgi:hypothetical protein
MTAYLYPKRKHSRTKVDQDLTVPVNFYPYWGIALPRKALTGRPDTMNQRDPRPKVFPCHRTSV